MDQAFSVQAGVIARNVFDNPSELIEILDSMGRAGGEAEQLRKQQKVSRVDCEAYQLDEAAQWKDWVSMLGIRVKGLRSWASLLCESCQSS